MNVPYKSTFKISQEYKGTAHDGFDMVGLNDKNIYSTVAGVVERAGWENVNNKAQGFGQYVRIKQDNSVNRYYFGHLSQISVRVGDRVNVGTKIGVEGSTGKSTGSHLHYCVRANGNKATPVDISKLTGIPNKPYCTYIPQNQGGEKPMADKQCTYVKDVPTDLKPELNEIINSGCLKGYGGTGDNRKIDLPLSNVRTLIISLRLIKYFSKGGK